MSSDKRFHKLAVILLHIGRRMKKRIFFNETKVGRSDRSSTSPVQMSRDQITLSTTTKIGSTGFVSKNQRIIK